MRHIAFVIGELRESAHDAVDGSHRWPRNVPHSACCFEAGHVAFWLEAVVSDVTVQRPLRARKPTFRCRGSCSKKSPPHRWAAAGPFAAMTAAHPVASRSPDRTGVCCAGRSASSRCEMVTGPGFSSPNQPDQERTTVYRDSSGPNSRSDAHCAANVGDWEEPSGESRVKTFER